MAGAGRTSRYSADQLDKIRQQLAETLGSDSSSVLNDLNKRVKPKDDAPPPDMAVGAGGGEDGKKGSGISSLGQINVPRLIQSGNVEKMVEALSSVAENPQDTRMLVAAILKNPATKSYHMSAALAKVCKDVELVDALVHGMVSRKGVNPLIDSIRYAHDSPRAMKALAIAIAEQGTVNHVIRALANSKDSPEAETIWGMEVMAKGSLEQMLEAMKLISPTSPGMVVLATGLVNREGVAVEQLVRGMTASKENEQATNLLGQALARIADPPAIVTVLEKYIDDSTEGGEIITARLMQRGNPNQLVSACRHVSTGSMASRMLAVAVTRTGNVELMHKAYRIMAANPYAKKILALEIVKRKGKIMALRLLGSDVFELVKNAADIQQFAQKAWNRYNYILKNNLADLDGPPAQEK